MMSLRSWTSANDAAVFLHFAGLFAPIDSAMGQLLFGILLIPCSQVQLIIHSFAAFKCPEVFVLALPAHDTPSDFRAVNAHRKMFVIFIFTTLRADGHRECKASPDV